MNRIYKFRFRRNKNSEITDKETPNKGSEFIKFKRVMARLDAQLAREESERKNKKNG